MYRHLTYFSIFRRLVCRSEIKQVEIKKKIVPPNLKISISLDFQSIFIMAPWYLPLFALTPPWKSTFFFFFVLWNSNYIYSTCSWNFPLISSTRGLRILYEKSQLNSFENRLDTSLNYCMCSTYTSNTQCMAWPSLEGRFYELG